MNFDSKSYLFLEPGNLLLFNCERDLEKEKSQPGVVMAQKRAFAKAEI